MTNYDSVEKRKVKAVVVFEKDNRGFKEVGINQVTSIEIIDFSKSLFLVNYEYGESEVFYDVSSVIFSK